MKILGIDSSGLVGTVAVVEDGNVIIEYTVNYKKTHSQTLLPMLDEIKQMIELDMKTIDAIAVTCGPGSFTGLRIGCATAKGLGMALDRPLIPIMTPDALAYNLYGSSNVICPIMDARRDQVYTGVYRFIENEKASSAYTMQCLNESMAVSIDEIIEILNSLGEKVVFIGDGVPVHKDTIAKNLKVQYEFARGHNALQRAASVALLGEDYFKAGKVVSAAMFSPNYLRVSQAERERMEHNDI